MIGGSGGLVGEVEVRDNALWIRHICGDPALRERLLGLPAGMSVVLEVDGFRGRWEKMKDGTDGRPTNGLKPVGPARAQWDALQEQRGTLVRIGAG